MEDKSKIVTRTVVESKHIEHIKDSDFENSISLKFKEPINICGRTEIWRSECLYE